MARAWDPIPPEMLHTALAGSLGALRCTCGCAGHDAGARHDAAYKRAAVMIVICGITGPRRGCTPSAALHPTIILTSKSQHLSMHAGEISFPGGKAERGDPTLLDTAMRETREEVGMRVPRHSVLGRLRCVRTRNTGYVIAPFVAAPCGDAPRMRPNPEVDEILEVPLYGLLGSMRNDDDPLHNPAPGMRSFAFGDVRGRTVWGATAQMLVQLRNIINADS